WREVGIRPLPRLGATPRARECTRLVPTSRSRLGATMTTQATLARIRICLVLAFAFACNPLDLDPKGQISDASFWKTPDQFELAANDFYFSLQGQNYIEVNSDIAFGSGATVDLSAVSDGSYLAPANSPVWNDAYTGIPATNYLLQKAAQSGLGAQIDR